MQRYVGGSLSTWKYESLRVLEGWKVLRWTALGSEEVDRPGLVAAPDWPGCQRAEGPIRGPKQAISINELSRVPDRRRRPSGLFMGGRTQFLAVSSSSLGLTLFSSP